MKITTEYKNEHVQRFTRAGEAMANELNQTERALCGQLMLLDTVILTALGLINSERTSGVLYPYAIMSVLLAVVFGVGYYFAILVHFETWAKIKATIAKELFDNKFDTEEQFKAYAIKKQEEGPKKSSQTMLILQVASTFLSMFFAALIFLN